MVLANRNIAASHAAAAAIAAATGAPRAALLVLPQPLGLCDLGSVRAFAAALRAALGARGVRGRPRQRRPRHAAHTEAHGRGLQPHLLHQPPGPHARFASFCIACGLRSVGGELLRRAAQRLPGSRCVVFGERGHAACATSSAAPAASRRPPAAGGAGPPATVYIMLATALARLGRRHARGAAERRFLTLIALHSLLVAPHVTGVFGGGSSASSRTARVLLAPAASSVPTSGRAAMRQEASARYLITPLAPCRRPTSVHAARHSNGRALQCLYVRPSRCPSLLVDRPDSCVQLELAGRSRDRWASRAHAAAAGTRCVRARVRSARVRARRRSLYVRTRT